MGAERERSGSGVGAEGERRGSGGGAEREWRGSEEGVERERGFIYMHSYLVDHTVVAVGDRDDGVLLFLLQCHVPGSSPTRGANAYSVWCAKGDPGGGWGQRIGSGHTLVELVHVKESVKVIVQRVGFQHGAQTTGFQCKEQGAGSKGAREQGSKGAREQGSKGSKGAREHEHDKSSDGDGQGEVECAIPGLEK